MLVGRQSGWEILMLIVAPLPAVRSPCPNHRKPLARYGAIEGALARGLLRCARNRNPPLCRARLQYEAWSLNLQTGQTSKSTRRLTGSRGPLNTGRDPYGDAVSVRLQIGTLSGFVSERRPASNRNAVRLQVGMPEASNWSCVTDRHPNLARDQFEAGLNEDA